MDKVWERCRALRQDVVADVHTHPMGFGQSAIDQANPMMPEVGHLALIVPRYANKLYFPGDIGMYEFRGRDGWLDHSHLGQTFFKLKGWY
ncbi:hypothetical protein [Dongia sp.]|uniref:hypothetical protein n=1 Tax=Dongia sp. TaxID=1977262 RepID=UPI0037520B5D